MIGFQSGGRLITDWAGQAGRHTVARVYAMREEQKNLTGHTSTDQPTAAGGLLVVAPQEESRETREELWMGRTTVVAAAVAGGQEGILEAGARAYDIKHYNYYLNSSRMAPGVAASSSSSLLLSPSLALSRLSSRAFSLSLSLCPLTSRRIAA